MPAHAPPRATDAAGFRAEVEANARLIAAAPDLLAALKRIRDTKVFLGAIAKGMMDEAIAAAEGQDTNKRGKEVTA